MTAPEIKVLGIDLFERPFRLRMPFRFGVITVTHGVEAIARVLIEAEARAAAGYAAEALAAKWFDKDLALSDEDNVNQLRKSLEIARGAYRTSPPRPAFRLFADHYAAQIERCSALGLNPLIASYGPALLDRAVLDALCRITGVSFYDAVRENLPGIEGHAIAPDLEGFDFATFLRGLSPASVIHARHTVGLVDPITRTDQESRVDDGLPETLEEVVAAYGNRYFKLKVGGDQRADLDRLKRIAAVLDRSPHPYFVSLDGNEQYDNVDGIAALWRRIAAEPRLERLAAATLYIEQPIRRKTALSEPVTPLAGERPFIIDESDGDLDAFPRARDLGYAGVSSKTCKGFYKSLINLARCRVWNAEAPRYFMSAEDLTTQPGLAVQQDLALVNLMGLTHVERNGHHFIDGFAGRSEREARAYLKAHPDLYREENGRVRLRIVDGQMRIGSLASPGFSSSVDPDVDALTSMPRAEWPPSASSAIR